MARFLVVIGLALAAACSVNDTDSQDSRARAELKRAAADEPIASPTVSTEDNWVYDKIVDEMRGTTSRRAIATSENSAQLGSPYGQVESQLMVRNRPHEGLDILLMVDQGQILCRSYAGQKISVKFDKAPVEKFTCSGTSDGSSEAIFIDPEEKFLRKLRASDRVVIEAEFYRSGVHQFKFDVAGLQGDY